MEQPLEIFFHNMRHSADIERLVRQKVGKLEKIYPRIIGCRVAVEVPHKQHKTGNVPEVHVEIRVPGQMLVVRREHHARERHTAPNARSSVRDAFDAAELKLKDFKRRQYNEVKHHPSPLKARVSDLFPARDYGFITTSESKQLYFHRNSVMDAPLETLKVGDIVQFIEGEGDTGAMAVKVWLANAASAEKKSPRGKDGGSRR